jgi:hypothetical protein
VPRMWRRIIERVFGVNVCSIRCYVGHEREITLRIEGGERETLVFVYTGCGTVVVGVMESIRRPSLFARACMGAHEF